MRRIAVLSMITSLLSACSFPLGPNSYFNHSVLDKSVAAGKTTDDWTEFTDLRDARKGLRSAARVYRERAVILLQVNDATGDLSAASLLAGALAGVTGSVDGVRYGTGLAGLFTFGSDRYQLLLQRDNLTKAAAGYECVADATEGLSDNDLQWEIIGDDLDKAKTLELNMRRQTLVAEVQRSARAIRNAFSNAMATKVTMKQPDIKQIEASFKAQQNNTPSAPQSLLAPLGGPGGGVGAVRLLRAQRTALIIQGDYKAALQTIADNEATIRVLTSGGTPTPEIASKIRELKEQQATAKAKLTQLEAEMSAAARDYLTGGNLSTIQGEILIKRISEIDNKLTLCRALMPE